MKLLSYNIAIMATALMFMSCDTTSPSKTSSDHSRTPGTQPDRPPETRRVTVKKWSKVSSAELGAGSPQKIARSLDDKNLYVFMKDKDTALVIRHFDGQTWSTIPFTLTGFDGTPGKAQVPLNVADYVRSLSAGSDGVLATISNSLVGKLVYFRGKVPVFAWAQDPVHVHATLATGRIVGSIVQKDGIDVPYAFDIETGNGVTHGELTNAKLDLPVKMNIRDDGLPSQTLPHLISTDKQLFCVDELGIRILPKSSIGTAANFPVVKSDDKLSADKIGSDRWIIEGFANNNLVSSVVAVNKQLFIGLRVAHGNDYSGGVAIYDFTTPKISAPTPAWKGISVNHLAVDKNKRVWAVTSTGLIEVKADGAPGEEINAEKVRSTRADSAQGKSGYTGVNIPENDLISIAFFQGSLVLMAKDGVFIMKETVE